MKTSRVLVVAFLFIVLSMLDNVKGLGADWKLFGFNDTGDAYYDAEGINRPSKDVVRFWEKVVWSEKAVIDEVAKSGIKYKTLSYTLALYEYHCAEKKLRTLSIVYYSTDGEVLFSHSQESEWEFIVPGSVGEDALKTLCK